MSLSTEMATSASAFAAVTRHPDDLLTSRELARSLKVSERAPENWRQHGNGPRYMRAGGRRVLYRWSDVLQWLETRRFSSTAEEANAA
jgi:predicted DNA-binding transcriptional regulator AlpA